MSIKSKRIAFAVSVALASIWNCCCLVELIPFSKWPFSFTLTSVATLLVLMPLLFPLLAKVDEKSKYYRELENGEKAVAGITIILSAVWIVTILACLIRSKLLFVG